MIDSVLIGLSCQSGEFDGAPSFRAFERSYAINSLPDLAVLSKHRTKRVFPVWRIILEDIQGEKRYFEHQSWAVFVNALRPGLDSLILSCERSCEFDAAHIRFLEETVEAIYPVRCFLEFEHHSWSKAAKELAAARTPVVQHDAPELPGIVKELSSRSKHRLLRLLGRNKRTWFEHSDKERFEYQYDLPELTSIAKRVRTMREESDSVTVIFATHTITAAIENARTLHSILSQ
jgi:uncharacterized protein YecE (DUF72 family)